jgi:hypothetical protein
MTLQELHELTGKVLKERPELATKELKQINGCGIQAIWQEVDTSSLHLFSKFDADRINRGALWEL